jgi:citrate lyase subunit beta/citryl-CoA lyase
MASIAESTALRRGEAGRCGRDVRSDCKVSIELQTGGGIAVELRSRVEAYYGEAIRAQVTEVLRTLGIDHARVLVEDEGALPFVLGARLEAAALRAGFELRQSWLPHLAGERPPSPRDRLRRSRLYLPGSEPKLFTNAGLYGADAIILDLEDSVHPDEKDGARVLVRNALRAVDFGGAERMVRINQLPLGLQDLEQIIPQSPDLVLLPKTETAEQVRQAEHCMLDVAQRHRVHRPIWMMPILESALGIEHASEIAAASERVVALTIGLEDYTADLGVVKTQNGDESLYARTRMVNAAKASGLQAIDSVYSDVADMDGLRAWAERSRALGFEGMGCIHPAQVAVVHEAFAPTGAEIEKAMKIVAAFDDAQAQGRAVVSLGSKMIDPPVVQRALKLVQRARQMGLIQTAPEAKA